LVHGLNESSLGGTARQIAEEHRVEVQYDSHPERKVFIRSDQYNFILHGIRRRWCDVGAKPGSPEEKIDKQQLTTRYRAPSEDVNQPVDLQAAALYNQMMLDTGLLCPPCHEREKISGVGPGRLNGPSDTTSRKGEQC
jgi:hypothetical protein